MSDFFQSGPALGNQYDSDDLLHSFLRWRLPDAVRTDIEPELRHLGHRAATDLLDLADAAEAEPPRHVPYDAWGRRVDRIVTSDAWRALDRISAVEGIVAVAYERAHGELSRVDQLARLYLFHPSSAVYSCPLAMTDGAARFLEVHGDARTRPAFEHLTTRDPARFWTSGQWMTERTGGSDVSRTSTIARVVDGVRGEHRLYGAKWFTSATTSQMAMTLARIEGAPEGSRGLSVFLIELREPDGSLRGIRVDRLKDKLGTRALPTAELTLDGTPAQLVGGAGEGVRKIATLFNVTRVYNAVAAVSTMRRAIALARDYAERRVAFGKPLAEQPLHVETLAELEVEYRAGFHLAFHVGMLLGKDECKSASEEEVQLLRLLIPLAKLYTGKQAVAVASEVVEAFGGAGYVEDTGIPRLLRDAQVLAIWEGTTNVLSLDVLRVMEKTDALTLFLADVRTRIDRLGHQAFARPAERVRSALAEIEQHANRAARGDAAFREAGARRFAFALARTYAASLLLEHAAWCANRGSAEPDAARAAVAAARCCERELARFRDESAESRHETRLLAARGTD